MKSESVVVTRPPVVTKTETEIGPRWFAVQLIERHAQGWSAFHVKKGTEAGWATEEEARDWVKLEGKAYGGTEWQTFYILQLAGVMRFRYEESDHAKG